MGEVKRRQNFALRLAAQALAEATGWVEPPSGNLQVPWIDKAAVTLWGQMPFSITGCGVTAALAPTGACANSKTEISTTCSS